MLGRLLGGRYQILNTLGAGNFGQTYLAADQHRPGQAKCVVKHLRPATTDQGFLPVARNLFLREAQTLERLGHHDQIPRLLAYFEQDQEFFLVQDYIPGQVLRAELSPRNRWSEAQVLPMLQDVLGVLEFVHSCGVIHRDLKPDNLIRRQTDQRLVLIDFGAVKQMRASIVGGSIIESPGGTTGSNTIAIGTPGYMPIEQAQGRPRPCSDLYALGMVAIQALTGKLPSQLPQDDQGRLEWQDGIDVSDRLANLLNRLVKPHFQDRYQTAAEVLAALPTASSRGGLWQKFGQLFRSPSLNDAELTQTLIPAPAIPVTDRLQPLANSPASLAKPEPQPATKETGYQHIFISYRHQEPDLSLAQQCFTALQSAGHSPFLSGQSGQWGPGWAEQVESELSRCDCFLLLLSPSAALSEIVLAEVRAIKRIQDQYIQNQQVQAGAYSRQRPTIIPIRINLPIDAPLNFELRGYLHRLQQRFWYGPEDTAGLIQDLLNSLASATGTATPPQPTTGGGLAMPTMPPANLDPDAPPLPVAEPELPEGQVDLASGFYLQRPPIETRCFETILQPGALIRIKAPRQMGKTSLMARILAQAGQGGYRTVPLSLQLADAKVFTDLDKFLRWLCVSVGRRLGLANQLQDYWDDIFGSKYNCTAYFEEYLLPQINQPLALGLDEVDRVFEYPEIASDFFGLLRAWHEEAKNRDVWKNLRLVVVHATEVYIPLNTNQSPFNVGLPIELPEFNPNQIAELARRHDLDWSPTQVNNLYRMIGGHPYLVRLALYHVARKDLSLDHLLATAPTETGLFRDHLRGQWWHLQHHPELANAFCQVIQASGLVRLETMDLFKLHSLGLIQLEGNEARLRCQLYRDYFAAMLSPN